MRSPLASVLGLACLVLVGCSASTSKTSTRANTPQYPDAYEVTLEICEAQSCQPPYKQVVWGPVGEAKLLKQSSFGAETTYKAVLSSKGCLAEGRPEEEQFYSTDRMINAEDGTTPTIKASTRKLSNEETHVRLQMAAGPQVMLAGFIPCAPVSKN